jgi:excisionase family DNA binding protein
VGPPVRRKSFAEIGTGGQELEGVFAVPIEDIEERISIKVAATATGVSVDTIRRRISDGSLPAYRLGKRLIRVSVRDLDRMFSRIPSGGDPE